MSEQTTTANMVSLDERRRKRSSNPLVAITYQLAHVMEDFELEACLIATDDGRLFAAPKSMEPEHTEILAAIAPSAWADPWGISIQRALAACDEKYKGIPVYAQEFWAFDQPLILLTITSAQRNRQEMCLHRTIRGIQRIARQATSKMSA